MEQFKNKAICNNHFSQRYYEDDSFSKIRKADSFSCFKAIKLHLELERDCRKINFYQ